MWVWWEDPLEFSISSFTIGWEEDSFDRFMVIVYSSKVQGVGKKIDIFRRYPSCD